ncbi:TPA: 3-deoxy-D-manno-oct-2-ulosonate III transferase WaaZ [Kluyvera ascorbata]|nr:3-deoxy-D-manno-oct-2-ulosonate III transferase WaaZ [Kluyvera ascorbata]
MSGKLHGITTEDINEIKRHKTSENSIIFLSGPSSLKTPLSLLAASDVISVNGSTRYLLDNNIPSFLYVLTDSRFLLQRNADFREFVQNSKYTIVNGEVYDNASAEDKRFIDDHGFVIRSLYGREKGGFFKKLKFTLLAKRDKKILIDVPFSKKKRLVGFSLDISHGYCSCHTVAFAALQVAYSLDYKKIVHSGLDLVDNCARFYDEKANKQASELSRDLGKILPFYTFMRDNVPDINVYNLSDTTAISYDIIPFITPQDV